MKIGAPVEPAKFEVNERSWEGADGGSCTWQLSHNEGGVDDDRTPK